MRGARGRSARVFQRHSFHCKLSFPLGGLEGELPDDRNRVAAPAADVVGEHHESSQNKLLEIIIENFEGVVVFQNKTRASNFGDDLIFLGYREFAGSAASFQKEFCIGCFNADARVERFLL